MEGDQRGLSPRQPLPELVPGPPPPAMPHVPGAAPAPSSLGHGEAGGEVSPSHKK